MSLKVHLSEATQDWLQSGGCHFQTPRRAWSPAVGCRAGLAVRRSPREPHCRQQFLTSCDREHAPPTQDHCGTCSDWLVFFWVQVGIRLIFSERTLSSGDFTSPGLLQVPGLRRAPTTSCTVCLREVGTPRRLCRQCLNLLLCERLLRLPLSKASGSSGAWLTGHATTQAVVVVAGLTCLFLSGMCPTRTNIGWRMP